MKAIDPTGPALVGSSERPLAHVPDPSVIVFRIQQIIYNCSAVVPSCRPEDIPVDLPFVNGPGPVSLDSIDAVEVAVMIKQEFGVAFKDAGSASKVMQNINSLAAHVQSALAEKALQA
jgi:acyl carrier protein